ncbi:hypothetical protein [Burkholderia sp. MBR-1]|uniref:hypothetical protein n=1 Tax=Burkholderia sp. MBR-1 TaxID=2732364 RepID=UPI0015EF4EFE|nr:hypothetical protein [Burkholderia sp. MBR-1]QMI49882.1 hypothetical protein MBR110_30955 [Burkholderia sp. MBR-1]
MQQVNVPKEKAYRVHLYAVVRVPIDVPSAASQLDAISKAERSVNLHADFNRGEYAEEIVGVLVDEQGDEDYLNSRNYVTSKESGTWIEECSAASNHTSGRSPVIIPYLRSGAIRDKAAMKGWSDVSGR